MDGVQSEAQQVQKHDKQRENAREFTGEEKKIEQILEEYIRPAVMQDGGEYYIAIF